MLESLEQSGRDPRSRELFVRHRQVYSLLELNVRLTQLKRVKSPTQSFDNAITDVSNLIAELVLRFEEATAPNRKPPYYSDAQINRLESATATLKTLCETETSIERLMEAAMDIVVAGAVSQFPRPRLVVSNS